jgi:EAL domain-containing protein (putative c-di-GMP-specific phosphodiesterase class I)
MTSRPPIAPFAFEPVMSIAGKRFHGLQLVYQEEGSPGYRPKAGHRPADIGLLADLVAEWRAHAPQAHFTFPCSFPEVAANGFADAWLSEARRVGIDPSFLELGLDPLYLPPQGAALTANLAQLRDAGVGICQLDFGTGYATMAAWVQVPLTRIELHPALFETTGSSAAILSSVSDMLNSLGFTPSARGVADEPQLELLAAHGCQLARGPAIAGSLRPIEVGVWLQEKKSRVGLNAD